jgi:cytidyltransferase-like protein
MISKNKTKYFSFSRPYVFVPMSADIIHHGHINILKKANKYGSVIVGLMTNHGIKSYKNKNPIFSYKQRKEILSQINLIKKIIPIDGLKYVEFAKKYKFDFFIHGSDWLSGPQSKVRAELKKIMPTWRGKVIDISYTKGISSSQIKRKIENIYEK